MRALLLFLQLALVATPDSLSTQTRAGGASSREASEGAEGIVPFEFAGMETVIKAPDAPGSWTVIVATRGGLATKPQAYVAASSLGSVTCTGQARACRSALDRPQVTTLSSLVTRSWPMMTTPLVSVCSDCVRIVLLVSERDAAGRLRYRSISWDASTRDRLAPEIAELVSAVNANALGNAR